MAGCAFIISLVLQQMNRDCFMQTLQANIQPYEAEASLKLVSMHFSAKGLESLRLHQLVDELGCITIAYQSVA